MFKFMCNRTFFSSKKYQIDFPLYKQVFYDTITGQNNDVMENPCSNEQIFILYGSFYLSMKNFIEVLEGSPTHKIFSPSFLCLIILR
jgi:hypothetical protein